MMCYMGPPRIDFLKNSTIKLIVEELKLKMFFVGLIETFFLIIIICRNYTGSLKMYKVFDSSILNISFWSSLYSVDVSFRHLDNCALFNVTYRSF